MTCQTIANQYRAVERENVSIGFSTPKTIHAVLVLAGFVVGTCQICCFVVLHGFCTEHDSIEQMMKYINNHVKHSHSATNVQRRWLYCRALELSFLITLYSAVFCNSCAEPYIAIFYSQSQHEEQVFAFTSCYPFHIMFCLVSEWEGTFEAPKSCRLALDRTVVQSTVSFFFSNHTHNQRTPISQHSTTLMWSSMCLFLLLLLQSLKVS